MARPTRRGIGARPLRVTLTGEAARALEQLLPRRIAEVPAAFARGDILDDSGRTLASTDPVRAGQVLWAFDPVPDEPDAPIRLEVVAATERWIIVDKPHGLATMPRGSHVARTVTVAARRQFANTGIVAAHRLDALTAGLLLLTAAPQWRRPYQQLFERREVRKAYRAVVDTTGTDWPGKLARYREQAREGSRNSAVAAPDLAAADAIRIRLHLDKPRANLQTLVLPSETHVPNSTTDIELVEMGPRFGRLRLHPRTGRTHQLRATCAHLGLPIIGDPLYPQVRPDLSLESSRGGHPLQLLAQELDFVDPVDGRRVHVHSSQRLALGETDTE